MSDSHLRLSARGAALVAVIAMGVVLGTIAWAVVRELGAVFFAFVFVFLLAFSAWFVLTRRHIGRVLGLLGVIFSIMGLVGFAGEHGLLLLILFAAIVSFGFAARYAVRHEVAAATNSSYARRRAPRSTCNGVLLINPKSGGGKATHYRLAGEARKRGIEPVVLSAGDDLAELAEQAVQDGADAIGMAGGDGSQGLVATVAMRHDVAHVCVPAGTRNNFARELGLDRDDILGALDAYADGVERRIDLASVNDRVYVNNASLGLYAHIVQSDAYRDAKLRTWQRMLPSVLGPGADSIDLRFVGPDGKEWADAALVVVSNNPYQLKRLSGAGTRHRLDGGHLGIVVTRMRRATDLAKLVTLHTAGQARRFGALRQWSAAEFEVHSDRPVEVGLDGESYLFDPPLRFSSLPGALRVRIPAHAKGVSPAGEAVTLSKRDLQRLLRIAAGRSSPDLPASDAARGRDVSGR